ncbi:MAG: hypothetical protein HXX11_15125 [Desulfuromonadales bacterium]|nr:hypothetical protein [Desulfuromonadales bacterium]
MSSINRILYTIANYDPRCVDNDKILDVREYYTLLNKLSEDGVNRFNNVLISMVRFLMQYLRANAKKKSKILKDITNAFMHVGFEDVKDSDMLYLVERVIIGDEVYRNPINVFNIDVRIFKAVLMRKLVHARIYVCDLNSIIAQYNLDQYFTCVKIGGVDDSKKINFVNRYNHYLYEFYFRSNDPNPLLLKKYLDNSRIQAMPHVYNMKDNDSKIIFSHELSLYGTFEQAEENIKEYCENITHYTKRMYELNYGEDALKSTTGQGNSRPEKKFEIYEECLGIYDRYKDIVPPDSSIDDDVFGDEIDQIEGTIDWPERQRLDCRKDIRKHFKNAQKLINQSSEGYLS